jgi:hypothetical protein
MCDGAAAWSVNVNNGLGKCIMMFKKTVGSLLLISAAALLVGCGSSSSKDDGGAVTPPPPPPPPPTTVVGSVATTTGTLDQFASVLLVSQASDTFELTVDANGQFNQQIPAGMYTVRADRPGYETAEIPGFNVVANQANALDVILPALPALTYIGPEDCGACHADYYDSHIQSGHANKIKKIVDGQPPEFADGFDRSVFFDLLEGSNCLTGDPIDGGRTAIDCPTGWDDVAYALGGVYKLRLILKDGYVMSGDKAQYDVPGTSYIMNARPPEGSVSLYDGNRYDCGVCHTTGYQHTTAFNPSTQEPDMPGIRGTWAFEGVHCEACHGAGAKHAQTARADDITRKAGARRTLDTLRSPSEGVGQAMSCYECHGRDSNRNLRGTSDWPSGFDQALAGRGIVPKNDPQGGRIIPAGNGLVRARAGDQTWTYWPAAPAGMDVNKTAPIPVDKELTLARSASFLGSHGDCVTCHDPHASTRAGRFLDNEWYDGPPGVDRSKGACLDCHALFDPQLRTGRMKDLQCVDCHAPYVSGTGVNWPGAGTRPTLGDIPAHIWRIDLGLDRPANDPLPQYTNQLLPTPAKSGFIYPYMTLDWACRTCHHDQASVPGLNGLDVPGSQEAVFGVDEGLLRFINFRFHNNLD